MPPTATRSRRRRGDTGRPPAASSPTTRPRSGSTRSSACSAGTRSRRFFPPTTRAMRSSIPSRRTSFAVANEVSGRDLTWFFDQVYRSSSVFDYGVDVFTQRARVRSRLLRRRRAGRRFSADERAGDLYRTQARRPARRRRGVPGHGPRRVREQPGGALAVGRARPLEDVRGRSAGPRRHGAQVDPDRVLLLDVNYTNNTRSLAPQDDGRGAQVVAGVAHLAAGSPADVWLLHLRPATRMTAVAPPGVTASAASTARRWCSSACAR